jgi:hypothetical protein
MLEAEDLYQAGKVTAAAAAYDAVAALELTRETAELRDLVVLAAERAVHCYQELAGRERFTPAAFDARVRAPLRGADAGLVRAAERALALQSGDPERASALRDLLGHLRYKYNHFDEALQHFADIIALEPERDVACRVALLSLEIHRYRQDWAELVTEARAFAANDRLACNADDRATLARVEQQAEFNRIEQEHRGYARPAIAAQAYLEFADRYPRGELACPAIQNAVVAYRAGNLVTEESRARTLLGRRCAGWAKEHGH